MVHKLSDVLEEIFVNRENVGHEIMGSKYDNQTPTPLYPDSKFNLDISDLFLQGGHQDFFSVSFSFKENLPINISIELQIVDKESSSVRPLLENSLKQTGKSLKVMPTHYLEYYVAISQHIYDEEDKEQNCQRYPNNQYQSYKECDEAYIRKRLKKYGFENETPIWATENIGEVTKNVMDEGMELSYLYTGVEPNSCKKPCVSTTTFTKTSSDTPNSVTAIHLIFQTEVKIEETKLVRFDFFKALSMLGGNMGLWLGLGVTQFIEMIADFSLFRK